MIVVNCRFLSQKISGVQRFAGEISRYLKNNYNDILFVSPGNIIQKDLAHELGVKIVGSKTGHLWEQIDLPKFLGSHSTPPLLINLANTAPLFWSKKIVTIHDLAVWDFPDSYSFKFRLFYKTIIPRITKSAIAVVTVSNFSKNRISETLKIPQEKIFVVPNGVGSEFGPGDTAFRTKMILAVSSLDPKKNFSNLIKAFHNTSLTDYKLVVVGTSNAVFNKSNTEKPLSDNRIEYTGYISDKELVQLYQTAELFVYPSLYEGFGIPPLEAMKCGCPVIVSNIPTLKEVCRDAAVYVNPLDVIDIKEKIEMLCSNENQKHLYSEKGKVLASRYTWEDAGRAFESILKSL